MCFSELVKPEWTCGRDPTLDLDYTFKRLDSNDHLYRILSRKQFQIVHVSSNENSFFRSEFLFGKSRHSKKNLNEG